VSRDYFGVMGSRVIAGRGFVESDGEGRPRVLLINEALARRDFADQNPVGQLVYMGADTAPWQIVGIVQDIRQFGLDREPEPQFFADLRQWSGTGPPLFPGGAYYAVRTTVDPMTIVPAVRRIVRDLDSQAALFYVAPMEQIVSATMVRPRMYAVLLGIFAVVGLTLAVIGIYGIVAFSVAQRTREIGIRVALGAQRAAILGGTLRHGLFLTCVGIVLGLAGAVALARYLEGMLFGITPADTATYVATAMLFVVVATVATLVPARRAMRLDPLTALRCD
jgi:predicted permease